MQSEQGRAVHRPIESLGVIISRFSVDFTTNIAESDFRYTQVSQMAAVAVGEKIGRANADFVREATGFAIGGVPPVGHTRPPIVLIDKTLLRFDNIWAAAGTPNAVFRLTPADLVALTGGLVVDVVNG